MPLVRIEVPVAAGLEHGRAIGAVVYEAMLETLSVPVDDRFQVITAHDPDGLVLDPGYLGIRRSAHAVIIDVTLNEGRTVAVKRNFYRAVADGLHSRLGVRREDVFIVLTEVKKENWSFGNGEAQYAE